jgi:hypothetical protein
VPPVFLQGQEVIARKYMATASLEGQWVLLQNTHLGLGYLTEVETFLVSEGGVDQVCGAGHVAGIGAAEWTPGHVQPVCDPQSCRESRVQYFSKVPADVSGHDCWPMLMPGVPTGEGREHPRGLQAVDHS